MIEELFRISPDVSESARLFSFLSKAFACASDTIVALTVGGFIWTFNFPE